MKKLFLIALLAGCATTSKSGPKPKFAIGTCLTAGPALVAKLNPQQRQMLSLVQIKVVDVGSSNYVLDQSVMGQLIAHSAHPFADVERDLVPTACSATTPTEPKPEEDEGVEAKIK